jgi:hypothetical protein
MSTLIVETAGHDRDEGLLLSAQTARIQWIVAGRRFAALSG